MRLTSREREVLALLAKGKRACDIAKELFVSTRTVEAHLAHIRDKTGAASTFDLAVKAARGDVKEW